MKASERFITHHYSFVLQSKSPLAQYGGRFTVTMLPGDGIGPEMMGYVKEVFRYAGAPVDFEEIRFDPNSESELDFFNAITSIKRNGVAIKGVYYRQ